METRSTATSHVWALVGYGPDDPNRLVILRVASQPNNDLQPDTESNLIALLSEAVDENLDGWSLHAIEFRQSYDWKTPFMDFLKRYGVPLDHQEEVFNNAMDLLLKNLRDREAFSDSE